MVSRVRPFRDGGVLGLIYGAFFFGGIVIAGDRNFA